VILAFVHDGFLIGENYEKINTACLLLLTAVALTVALMYTRAIMVPFVFSIFVYFLLSPTVRWLEENARMSRTIAVTVTLIGFVLVSASLLFLIALSVGNFLDGAEVYQNRIAEFLKWGSARAAEFGVEINARTIRERVEEVPLFSVATGITGSIFGFFGNFLLVVVFALFMIAGERRQKEHHELFRSIQGQVSTYIWVKTMTSGVTGILFGVIFQVFQIELAFMFAVLTVILNFVPNLGSIVATLLPLPIVLLQYGFGWSFAGVLTLCSLTQFIVGSIIDPKLLGDSMELHPITVLASLIFWGIIWGIPGLFLAVPLTGAIRIVLRRMDITQPVAELLSGRIPG